jgi:hypothetical protein
MATFTSETVARARRTLRQNRRGGVVGIDALGRGKDSARILAFDAGGQGSACTTARGSFG